MVEPQPEQAVLPENSQTMSSNDVGAEEEERENTCDSEEHSSKSSSESSSESDSEPGGECLSMTVIVTFLCLQALYHRPGHLRQNQHKALKLLLMWVILPVIPQATPQRGGAVIPHPRLSFVFLSEALSGVLV